MPHRDTSLAIKQAVSINAQSHKLSMSTRHQLESMPNRLARSQLVCFNEHQLTSLAVIKAESQSTEEYMHDKRTWNELIAIQDFRYYYKQYTTQIAIGINYCYNETKKPRKTTCRNFIQKICDFIAVLLLNNF